DARINQHLTQKELAAKAGIAQTEISRIENGTRNPSLKILQRLAEGMGFTVVPFGQGFKDMSPPTKELMKLTLEQRIAHGGHPVLRWMFNEVVN
ncbi:helix-turn-helix domain-containing protein, partial [Acidaminococcus fermentans]